MKYPKISIVTVNFNKAKYLERTILSILNQNYPNLEYVIIDGGSTDGSIDIIRKYSDRLAYWISEPDNGMYDALKKGFAHTSGDIMAWINSDDMYHKNSFFTISDIFSNMKHVNWIVGALTHWDDNDRCVHIEQSRYFNRAKFLMGDIKYIQQESTFWRRSLYDSVGGIDTIYKLAGDFSLWMKFSRSSELFVLNALVGGFRISQDEQLSDNFDAYMKEVDTIIKNEEVDDRTAKYISTYKKKEKLFKMLRKISLGWLNTERLQRYLFRDWYIEEQKHRINYKKITHQYSIG